MKIKNLLKVAYKSIIKNRMRSFLTMLGIIIGVGAVIALVAIGQGTSEEVENQISSLGSNLIMVMPGSSHFGGVSRGAGSINSLTLKDVNKLKKESAYISEASAYVRASGQVIAAGKNWSTSINGVDPNYLIIKDWELEKGNFFTKREIRSRAKVAVLGKTVSDELFEDSDPVGQSIRIRNIPFKVIGVLDAKGSSMMGDQDDVILVPTSTALYRMTEGKNISMIMVSAVSNDVMEEAQEEIETILRKSHNLKDEDASNFRLRSQTEIIDRVSSVTGALTVLLGAIAAVSLLVGGIGIMNIMLVSVTERTKEIGIRLAIGARGKDVLVQFLIEAVLLSLVGGIIGIIFGVLLANGASYFMNMSIVLNPFISLMAFSFSGAVGVFFGFYPARKAAAMDPIEALRYE
ncbi:MAG: ABC transporter permease [Candidatus Aminicenantes bacterium]|nr:ABC transporter permease [Candidatus Aminicenantes bacterium]